MLFEDGVFTAGAEDTSKKTTQNQASTGFTQVSFFENMPTLDTKPDLFCTNQNLPRTLVTPGWPFMVYHHFWFQRSVRKPVWFQQTQIGSRLKRTLQENCCWLQSQPQLKTQSIRKRTLTSHRKFLFIAQWMEKGQLTDLVPGLQRNLAFQKLML